MGRASRFVTCQLMILGRAIWHATLRLVVLASYTLRHRIESAFQPTCGFQAKGVMDVVALRKCARAGKCRRKQDGSEK
jgi:hypothetical protein